MAPLRAGCITTTWRRAAERVCDALLNVLAWMASNFVKSYADSTFADLLKALLKDLLGGRESGQVPFAAEPA